MANKKCIVFETLGATTGLEIQEAQNNEIRLTGVFGVCGVKNENRRIYSKENYGMMVNELQKVIVSEGLMGELEHPNTMNINLNNVSHKIESIEMNEDGTITGTILLLDTAKGKDAQAIVKGGLPLYISSRGAGSIDESGHVTLSTIKTYDLVGTPGFSQARLNLASNQTLECLNESKEDGNEIWVITEGEDLLSSGDDDDDKDKGKSSDEGSSDDKDKSSDDNSSDDADNKKEDKENKEEEGDNKEDEDNNKNSNTDTTMNDLKEAIDKLTEKVTSLEAELHVAQESLAKKDDEIATLNEKLSEIKPVDYDSIQTWVSDEFAPNFKAELSESINSDVQVWAVENFAQVIQNWVCEEFAPEVENWVCEEFAPEVQNWVCEEFAPEVQNWVCEEFAPVVEGWCNDELIPEASNTIEAKVNENVSAFMENQKSTKLSEIDALLESIDSSKKDNVLEQMVKEQKDANKFAGVYAVENMPAEYQPSWNGLNEERQNEIVRMSKAYDFTKEGVLEKFWAEVDFNQVTETKQPETKDITESYYSRVMGQMMRLRKA